jgi:glycosyltransferase involved in cell wall biosynthesis
VLGRCVKGSGPASLLAAAETAHQHHRRLYKKHVARFLCPSRFYRDKYAAWGYPAERLEHLPNFVDAAAWRPEGPPAADPCYLYFGRISAEKGLADLLAAQRLWEDEAAAAGARPDAPGGAGAGGAGAGVGGSGAEAVPRLLVAGSGPWDGELRRRAAALGLRRVEVLGPLAGAALRAAVARARFTVVPSTWYENAPLAVLESMAAGRPVAGAAIGGVPELIADGEDGVLFPPGDPPALLAGLRRALALGPEAGARARAKAERLWSRPAHMARLQAILKETAAGR